MYQGEPALARSQSEAAALLNNPSPPNSLSVIEANFTLPQSQLRAELETFAAGGCSPDALVICKYFFCESCAHALWHVCHELMVLIR